MLKVMRDSFQHLKWILVFIVFVFILFIFVDWGAGRAQSGDNENFAARVNGETITLQDFNRATFYLEQRYEQMYGQNLTAEMREALGLPRQVLNSLIDETLLLQEARRLDLEAKPEEIRQKILEMPIFSQDGKFVGPELYERYVRTQLQYPTAAAFEEEMGRNVTLEKIHSALRNSIILTPAAVEAEYRRRNESAKIRYVLLAADPLVESATATPAEVETYYRGHSTDFSHPEQRNVKYLLADLARIRSQVSVTEDEIRARYEAMKGQFQSGESVQAQHILLKVESNATLEQQNAVEKKARDLVVRLRAGADFAALAREHSQDPGSAANGGDLGFFERGRMVAEFEQAAFSTPVGTISDPVKTPYGYHIIRVNEKRPGGLKPLSEVRAQLEAQLRTQKASDSARERIAQAKTRIDQAKPKTDAELRSFASEFVSFNETGWFAKNDPVPGLGRVPALNDWAFSAETGSVGTQIETSRGPIIPYLAEKREPGISPLDEVRDRVANDLKRQKAREAAQKQLQAAFSTANSLDATAKQLSLTPVEANVTRLGVVTGLSGNIQNLINSALGAEAGSVKGPLVVDQGAIVFEVVERKKFDPQEFATTKDSTMQALQEAEFPKLRASLLAALRQKADIEINNSLIQPAAGQPTPAG